LVLPYSHPTHIFLLALFLSLKLRPLAPPFLGLDRVLVGCGEFPL